MYTTATGALSLYGKHGELQFYLHRLNIPNDCNINKLYEAQRSPIYEAQRSKSANFLFKTRLVSETRYFRRMMT